MKPLTFFFVLFAFCLPILASAAEFSPDLEYQLSNAQSGGNISAIVILRSPIDIRALDAQMHATKATKAQRHFRVLEALHYNADQTQPAFRSELDRAQAKGAVVGYTPYWIENLFVILATKDFIEGLRSRGDIEFVTENFRPELIEPIRSSGHSDRNPMDTRTVPPGIRAVGALRVCVKNWASPVRAFWCRSWIPESTVRTQRSLPGGGEISRPGGSAGAMAWEPLGRILTIVVSTVRTPWAPSAAAASQASTRSGSDALRMPAGSRTTS